jgi:hypothetical protein
MRVRVSSAHIRDGERDSFSLCPVALAVSEALGGLYCEVWPEAVYVVHGAHTGDVRLPIPEGVRQWVRDYDTGGRVRVIEFELPDGAWETLARGPDGGTG